ncbi:MAG: DUF4252 domain-containing protein [Bacteroidetes bacterium]|nr:MAG: DUF4252 domain-containing protein [Bacteroidota bacterium]
MKYLTICFGLFFLMGISAPVQAQESADAISKYFNKYLEDERFTVVYVSGKLFSMFKDMELDLDDEEAEAIISVVEDLKGLRILTTEENGGEFYREALNIINKNEYETLMEVRQGKDENVQFLVKQDGDKMHELLLLVGGKDQEFVLVSFIGSINLNKIGELQKAFDKKDQSQSGNQ